MKDYRIKVTFNDCSTVSFTFRSGSFYKAVKAAVSFYPDDIQRRICSINVEDITIGGLHEKVFS